MKPEWLPWINRVGLVLDFLAFWLVAPEIVGEPRLVAVKTKLEVFLSKVIRFLDLCFRYSFLVLFREKKEDLELFPRGLRMLAPILSYSCLIGICFYGIWDMFFENDFSTWPKFTLGFVGIATFFVLDILIVLMIVFALLNWLLVPVLNWLTSGIKARQLFLAIGIAFYVVGFLLQFISTF